MQICIQRNQYISVFMVCSSIRVGGRSGPHASTITDMSSGIPREARIQTLGLPSCWPAGCRRFRGPRSAPDGYQESIHGETHRRRFRRPRCRRTSFISLRINWTPKRRKRTRMAEMLIWIGEKRTHHLPTTNNRHQTQLPNPIFSRVIIYESGIASYISKYDIWVDKSVETRDAFVVRCNGVFE